MMNTLCIFKQVSSAATPMSVLYGVTPKVKASATDDIYFSPAIGPFSEFFRECRFGYIPQANGSQEPDVGQETIAVTRRGRTATLVKLAVPNTVAYRDVTYNRSRKLGSGTYGVVYEYVRSPADPDADKPTRIAVKTSRQHDESVVVNLLHYSGVNFAKNWSLLRSPSELQAFTYTLMPVFKGTLDDFVLIGPSQNFINPSQKPSFIRSLTSSEAINVVKRTLKCLLELKQAKMTYMDIKPQNIFYYVRANKPDDQDISVMLGDIGSISYPGAALRNRMPCTYPPPEAADLGGIVQQTESTMLWSCGVLLVVLSTTLADPLIYSAEYMRDLHTAKSQQSLTQGMGFSRARRRTPIEKTRESVIGTMLDALGSKRSDLETSLRALVGSNDMPSDKSFEAAIELLDKQERKLDTPPPLPPTKRPLEPNEDIDAYLRAQ